jgi:hypothetical protein
LCGEGAKSAGKKTSLNAFRRPGLDRLSDWMEVSILFPVRKYGYGANVASWARFVRAAPHEWIKCPLKMLTLFLRLARYFALTTARMETPATTNVEPAPQQQASFYH